MDLKVCQKHDHPAKYQFSSRGYDSIQRNTDTDQKITKVCQEWLQGQSRELAQYRSITPCMGGCAIYDGDAVQEMHNFPKWQA